MAGQHTSGQRNYGTNLFHFEIPDVESPKSICGHHYLLQELHLDDAIDFGAVFGPIHVTLALQSQHN